MSRTSFFALSTLQQRLTLGVLAQTVISVAFIALAGVLSTYYASEISQSAVLTERLSRLASIFRQARDQIFDDARILGNTPSVRALIENDETPSRGLHADELTRDYWRHQVEDVFKSFLELRKSYIQIRLISSETGNELSLARRQSDGTIVTTPLNHLPESSDSDSDFLEIINSLSKNQTFFSDPLTREAGETNKSPRVIIFKTAISIFDASQNRRGALVIDINPAIHKKELLEKTDPMGAVAIRYSRNKYLIFDREIDSANFFFGNMTDIPTDILSLLPTSLEDSGSLRIGNRISAFQRLNSETSAEQDVTIALINDHVPLFGIAGQFSLMLMLFAAAVTLTAALFAWKFILSQTLPLTSLKNEIIRAGSTNDAPKLPIERTDEVGEISRAFYTMIQTIAAREERLRVLFEGVRDGICLAAESGRIFATNPALDKMFGYESGELVGKDIGTLMTDAERLDHSQVIYKHMNTGSITRIGRTTVDHAQRKDGSPFDIELSVNRLDNRQETYFSAVIRDVSDRSRADAEREKLIDALRHSNAELDSFAYVASHDLKAPLRAIATASAWLKDDLAGKLDEDTQETFDMIRNRVNRMSQLLDGLLEHSQIGRKTGDTESPRLSGEDLALDLNALVNAPSTFNIKYSDAFLQLSLRQLPLRTVLLNLISNAIKHHDRPDGTVWIDGQTDGTWITFTVKDDGPGIAPEFHDRVFQLFQTLRSRDRVEGTGLGLAICRKQVRHMGGELTLHSDGEGTGATFTFTWPIATSETQIHATQ